MSDQAIVVQVTPSEPNPENHADMAELAGLFFIAGLVIFLARRLADLFRADHD